MIVVTLDKIMKERRFSLNELADKVGITLANMSLLKNGKVKGVRFSTISKICEVLDCQPGDFLTFVKEGETI